MTDYVADGETISPINVQVRGYGQTMRMLYRYSLTKAGKFRVSAVYTGLPTGCIGSAGKSFDTAEERDAATLASCERYIRACGGEVIRPDSD